MEEWRSAFRLADSGGIEEQMREDSDGGEDQRMVRIMLIVEGRRRAAIFDRF